MELTQTFTVPMAPAQAAAWFADPANVAACFPGLSLPDPAIAPVDPAGSEYAGSLRVKLGSLSVTYVGTATVAQPSPEVFTVNASGTARGIGSASIVQTATLAATASASTAVSVVTELTINGRPAQFGYDGIQGVATKLTEEFAAKVAAAVAPEPEPEPEPEPKAPTAAQEALDTGAALAGMYRKQMLPIAAAGLVLVVILLRRLLKRS